MPHELTFPKAKEDRLALLRATRTNTSAIFGVFEDGRGEIAGGIARHIEGTKPTAEATVGGDQHRVWAVGDRLAIGEFRDALARRRVYIADGHHRYETALTYLRTRRGRTRRRTDRLCSRLSVLGGRPRSSHLRNAPCGPRERHFGSRDRSVLPARADRRRRDRRHPARDRHRPRRPLRAADPQGGCGSVVREAGLARAAGGPSGGAVAARGARSRRRDRVRARHEGRACGRGYGRDCSALACGRSDHAPTRGRRRRAPPAEDYLLLSQGARRARGATPRLVVRTYGLY